MDTSNRATAALGIARALAGAVRGVEAVCAHAEVVKQSVRRAAASANREVLCRIVRSIAPLR
jgi:hypothetical protein